jgi:hypothetical protein
MPVLPVVVALIGLTGAAVVLFSFWDQRRRVERARARAEDIQKASTERARRNLELLEQSAERGRRSLVLQEESREGQRQSLAESNERAKRLLALQEEAVELQRRSLVVLETVVQLLQELRGKIEQTR